jgi:fructose-1,6-bisphosphatase/inositol monophosphatase family enzyme
VIVEEAGGRVSAADGAEVPTDGSSLVATNGLLHDAVMERIRDDA